MGTGSPRRLWLRTAIIGVLFAFFPLTLLPGVTHAAAPLTWTGGTAITLSSPTTTLTIATGSVADSLTVNATSVVVSLSASTGGDFALLSSDYNLSVATSSTGGTAAFTCSANTTDITISQASGATIYTITPTSGTCSVTGTSSSSAPVSSGITVLVGGGGGTLITPTSSASGTMSTAATTGSAAAVNVGGNTIGTPSLADLWALLMQLEAQLCSLASEARTQGIDLPAGIASFCPVLEAPTPPSSYIVSRDLELWDTGNDVKALQEYLVAQDKGPAAMALGRHGTTDTFGHLTYAALVEFQRAVGIVPHSGYFGRITRGYVEANP